VLIGSNIILPVVSRSDVELQQTVSSSNDKLQVSFRSESIRQLVLYSL